MMGTVDISTNNKRRMHINEFKKKSVVIIEVVLWHVKLLIMSTMLP